MTPKCKEAFDFYVNEIDSLAWTRLHLLRPRDLLKLQTQCLKLSTLIAQARNEIEELKEDVNKRPV